MPGVKEYLRASVNQITIQAMGTWTFRDEEKRWFRLFDNHIGQKEPGQALDEEKNKTGNTDFFKACTAKEIFIKECFHDNGWFI